MKISRSLIIVTAALSPIASVFVGAARGWPAISILLYTVYVFAAALLLHAIGSRLRQVLSGLALVLVVLFLTGCEGSIRAVNEGEATRMAYAPTATAVANANNAEATRVAVIAGEKARLELERDQKLQDLTLLQQADQQVEEHTRQMAIISSTYAYSMALIQTETISRTALISANLQVALNDSSADMAERSSEAFGKQAVNTGIGLGGVIFFSFLGIALSVGAFYFARRKGQEVRPDRRTGRLPILSLGWFHINWNRTSASAIKAYRPGFLERREAFKLLREGRITADEARKLIEPTVEQIGDPQLELAAAQSADQRDALVAGMWNLKDGGGVHKSLASRLSDKVPGLIDATKNVIDQIPMPQPKQIPGNAATIQRLEAAGRDEGGK